MSLEFSSTTVYAPLNTVMDADRDYRDHVLSGLGGCPGGCPVGAPCVSCAGLAEDTFVEREMKALKIWGVPLLLVGIFWGLPRLATYYGEKQGW